ncbi:hypothetical protein OG689_02375 [Kitasatospora sp. NBC_00240]|uniref:hypothetical protein n=1 Tax=Kitasatospora sp. NBC_00240 TaxID=2903567 RepID=UPI00224E2923|nr:hypothetical protein [Kitasatospora sp. NBC_00240]MCX5208165.1 hypothetical protein [Kitasatospora sp. NBC_00240]
MTVPGTFHLRTPVRSTRAHGPSRVFLTALLRRLADSPLDNTVLQALGGPSPAGGDSPRRPPVPLQASWRPVVSADGRRRLEARWDSEH